jgi:hypothetical protein
LLSDEAAVGKVIVQYYEGKRFVKKDCQQLISLAQAARTTREDCAEAKTYLLLSADAGICRRNSIPQLIGAGFVVQRVADGESTSKK